MSSASRTTSTDVPDIAAVDLFCGAGGKTHGFIKEGIPVVAGIDVDATCAYAFESNNAGAKFYCKSVDELSPEEVASWYPFGALRVLIGCAPCQPFSTYSYRYRASTSAAHRDRRWGLLDSFSKIVHQLQPEIVTAENVPELARQKHRVYTRFITSLRKSGYYVMVKIVKCADYGVPQTRERLVVLASRIGPIDLVSPTHGPDRQVTVRDRIGDLPRIPAGGPPPDNDTLHRSSKLSLLNLKRIRATTEGGGWQSWPAHLRAACHRKNSGKTYPSVYGRMRWDDLAPTITTQCYGFGSGRFGHPEQDRAISLREAAMLQGFPRDYAFVAPGEPVTFINIGRHIGNAVPVELGQAIARSIIQHVQTAACWDGGIRAARGISRSSR
jgi:DNA (cytosine-5)-methyltransferase 1